MHASPLWKRFLIWLAGIAAGFVIVLGLVDPREHAPLSPFLPRGIISGVDLQGGSQLVFRVERADIVRIRLEATVASVRAKLRDAAIRYTGLTGTDRVVTVTISDPSQIEAAADLLSGLAHNGDLALERGEGGEFRVVVSPASIDAGVADAGRTSVDNVARRIAALGNTAFVVRRDGDDRVAADVFGAVDVERLKNMLTQPAKLSLRFVDESMSGQDALNGRWPAGSEVLYSLDDPPVPYLVERAAIAANDDLINIRAGSDLAGKTASLTFSLDENGLKKLASATRDAVGRRIAFILDDQVMALLPIERPVLDGILAVPVNFTDQGVQDLAAMLKAGPMAATLTPVEERSVNPVAAGRAKAAAIAAGAGAAVLVLALMLFFYRRLGIIAGLSLGFVLLLVFGILGAFGVTLTLPGLAGVVLIMGMAVDANVLIYERMREEAKAGSPLINAAEAAFIGARASIVDANVTIAIAALLLFLLGSESVRGFVYVLAAGVVAILFTTFTFTQALVIAWVRRRRSPKRLPRALARPFLSGANIRFMGIRRYIFTISAVFALSALVALASLGLNLGVDFSGGSAVEVRAKQGAANPTDLVERLRELNLGDVEAYSLVDPANALIRVPSQDAGENGEQSALTLLRDEVASDYDIGRVEVAGPSISGEATRMASLAILSALATILLYIFVRFGWRFAIGALVATLHDIVLLFGFFLVTRIAFDLTAVAALLTVICYSLNDTIVVYDRMRQNLKRYRTMPLPLLIDASINQTLSRTVLTSATTALGLLSLALFGGAAIRPFAATMLFGIAVGTFSSIYIAAPVMILFRFGRKAAGGGDHPGAAGASTGTAV